MRARRWTLPVEGGTRVAAGVRRWPGRGQWWRRGAALLMMAGLLAAPGLAQRAKEAAPASMETAQQVEMARIAAAHRAMREAMLAAWRRLPFHVASAHFVKGRVGGYGMYTPRGNARFAPGEKLRVYLEPAGYAFRPREEGGWRFGMRVDVMVADENGKVLGGKKNFTRVNMGGLRRNTEFFLLLNLDLGGLTAGRYRLMVVLTDEIGGQDTRVELPFEVAS